MAALVEINQVGKREDLRDFLTIADAKEKPFMAMCAKASKPVNMLISWQADAYDDPDKDGVEDGTDVNTFENAGKDRALVQNYCQKWRRTAMVGDLAENVSNVAGVKSELARSITKKLEEISRDMEATFCSDNSAQLETGAGTPYKTRGLGAWIASSYSGVDSTQVPAIVRPPAASLTTTTPITQTILGDIAESVFTEYGRRQNLVFIVGTNVKRVITGFTQTQLATPDTNTFNSIRTFNQDLESRRITNNVTVYEGDFNTIEIHTSLLLRHTSGATGDQDTGFLLPMDKYAIAFHRMPRVKQLEDRGGGPRALVDAVAGLIALNPRTSGKVV